MPVKMNNRFVTHRVNLFEPDLLFSINCLAFNPDENKLAVLRRSLPQDLKPSTSKLESKPTSTDEPPSSHSAIEIWNWTVDHRLTLDQVVHEDEDDPCLLESLGWSFDGRLWTCGLNGRLHQIDLVNSLLLQGHSLVSGAGWCLQFNKDKTLVAVGTEEGYINIFNVSVVDNDKYGIEFVKTTTRDKGRVLSVAWYEPDDESGKRIVSGSTGVIKIWNYETGSCLNVLRSNQESTIFWCLTVAEDFTIVAGDSKGYTSFWDGKNALLINSLCSHKSDILCLTQSADSDTERHNILYTSGTDPRVVTFSLDSNGKGIQSTILHIHSNDVRSMVYSKDWLISGGFDCYLTQMCAHPQKQIKQAPHFNNLIRVDKTRLLFQYSKCLQIWGTGSTSKPTNNSSDESNAHGNTDYHDYRDEVISYGDSSTLPLIEGPTQLFNIQSKRLIHHSNFSGPWICYSVLDKVRILYCTPDAVAKVPILCDLNSENVTGIQFVGDKFVLLSSGLRLYVFKLDTSGIVSEKQFKYKHRIVRMSACSEYIAFILANKSVSLISTSDWSLVHRFKLHDLPVCIQFNQYQKDLLWFGFANHLIMSFSISTSEFSKFSFNESNQHLPLIGLTFHPNGFIAYDQDRLYHYNGSTWTSSDRYSHLAKVHFMDDKQELLLIEVTQSMIKKKLPIRFTKKKFGT